MPNHLLNVPSLLLIALTLNAFYLANSVSKKNPSSMLLHPLPVSVLIVISGLWYYQIPYADYLESHQVFQWLIGPAVVALAIPLHQHLQLIRQWLAPIVLTITLSIFTSGLLLCVSATLFDIPLATQIALSTKSVTTPIALSINELLNGQKALAATLVMLTGIAGTTFGTVLLEFMKIKDDRVKGVVLGLTSHAIGTQKAFEISPVCGAFAVLTMTLAGIILAIVLPFFSRLFVQ